MAQIVHTNKATEKSISHILARYHAGIIATSEGKGMKDDSITIIMNIPVYHNSEAKLTIIVIISCIF